MDDGKLSPSAFIPFCSFAGNWSITGEYSDILNITVCNIFKKTIVNGQLCYRADVNKFKDKVEKKKIAKEGFVFLLDYNENRMVEIGGEKNENSIIYIETVGKKYNLSQTQTATLTQPYFNLT